MDAYYKKAQLVRSLIRRDFDAAFLGVDVLLTPTAPGTAFRNGSNADDPLAMYLADLLTIPANLAGLPAISVPCGFDNGGLPIGVQLIVNVLEEPRCFSGASVRIGGVCDEVLPEAGFVPARGLVLPLKHCIWCGVFAVTAASCAGLGWGHGICSPSQPQRLQPAGWCSSAPDGGEGKA